MEQRISFQETPKGYLDGAMKIGYYLNKSDIDRKLLHLIDFRVSQMNRCMFCLDMHYKDAIHEGETEQRLYSLPSWPESPFYTEAEKAALRFAENLTSRCETDDATFDALAQHFTKDQIATLAMAVAAINMWNRLNAAFLTTPGTYKVGSFTE
jgi:AhpD family alkylhydroperoxidase